MANEQNLIPFKPGQSGNPKGRPKSRVPEQLVKIFGSKARAKKFYSLSAGEIDEWESAILSMSANDLKLLAKWDEAPAYPKGLAIAVLNDMKNGKTTPLDKYRDRGRRRRLDTGPDIEQRGSRRTSQEPKRKVLKCRYAILT